MKVIPVLAWVALVLVVLVVLGATGLRVLTTLLPRAKPESALERGKEAGR